MYIFEDGIYPSLVLAQEAAIEAHPELLDDDMPDFFDDNIEEMEKLER